MIKQTQVLRDKIGTAMTNKKSRADQFSLIIHGQEGEGGAKEGFLGKEGADVCVTQKMCHRSYSRIFTAAYGAAKSPS